MPRTANINIKPTVAVHIERKITEVINVVVAKIQAGFISAKQISTDSLAVTTEHITIGGKDFKQYITDIVTESIGNLKLQMGNSAKVISPLAEVDHIHTNIISPLGKDQHIAVKINSDSLSIAKDASSAAVAIIDNQGNASFSGSLKSNELAVNADATISGTLHAHKIEADDIVGLSAKVGTLAAQNITNVTNIFFATPSATPTTIATIDEATSSSNRQQNSLMARENYENISIFICNTL